MKKQGSETTLQFAEQSTGDIAQSQTIALGRAELGISGWMGQLRRNSEHDYTAGACRRAGSPRGATRLNESWSFTERSSRWVNIVTIFSMELAEHRTLQVD